MIVIHGLKTCDTCRKAMKMLASSGIDARLRDLRADPVTLAELARWSDRLGPGLLNIRSATWRGLDAAERETDPIALMAAHPALIKRPVIEMAGSFLLGWTAASCATLGVASNP